MHVSRKKSEPDFLERLYESLLLAAQANGKLRNQSLLLSTLEIKNNVRFDLLNKSAMGTILVPQPELDRLLAEEVIFETMEPLKYAITAKGIWQIETARRTLTEKQLIEYLDAKYFREIGNAPALSEKERVILLGLVAARAFGDAQPVDLHVAETVKERWKSIFLQAHDFLAERKLVTKLQREAVFGKTGNEHPVSNLVRHTDALPRKTKGIYSSLGNQRYCLAVVDDGEIVPKQLAYLITLIFGDDVTPDLAREATDFCRRIAHDDCLYIYDVDKNPFIGPKEDEAVRNAIMSAAGLA